MYVTFRNTALLAVVIRVRFNIRLSEADRPPQYTRGSIFGCVVQLRDYDIGKMYAVRAIGWCAPHDPKRESRSAKVEEF